MLTALVPLALRPSVAELTQLGRQLAAGEPVNAVLGNMAYPPIVSPTALLVAMTLAVFKPWGLIRKRPASRSAATAEAAGGQSVDGRAWR
ncbi:hypothetical protein ACNAW0_19025 [Micromonospora sp. SL1-18]|uniref:hypothetical protein n=1 Tax=Micromonospora sp. SL1-18 TaxID=3399128 RepID=UPI003A4E102B